MPKMECRKATPTGRAMLTDLPGARRIAKVYEMQGGPREQIMKKCLRFTDKGQTEQQVVNEIRSALDRWQQMLDEDK